MSIQPIVLSYRGRPDPTERQLRAASRLAQNAALKFEQMTGVYPRYKAAIPLRDDSMPLGSNASVATHPTFFAMASLSLASAGYDPSEGLYLVYLMQGRAAGEHQDNSGLGNPTWTQEMYDSGEWGWQERAKPTAGGVALIGEGCLNLVPGTERPRGKRYGPLQRHRYHRALLTTVHELAHAMGVPHAGYEPSDHPSPAGEPRNDVHRQRSVMAYGYAPDWPWIMGTMRGVGFYSDELATIRRSVHTIAGKDEYTHVYSADRERIAGGDQARR